MKSFVRGMLGLTFGLTLGLVLSFLAGENPAQVFLILIKSAFGSTYDLGMTLSYTAPLIFTGLSVCVGLRAGLFNIGGEGQLLIATSVGAWAALKLLDFGPLGSWIGLPLVCVLAAGIWGGIAGFLKAWRGSHEVIVTMMLNFLAAGIANFIALHVVPNPLSQNPETAKIPEIFNLSSYDVLNKIFLNTPVNFTLIVAVVAAILLHYFFSRTRWGYEMKIVGQNSEAATRAGISVERYQVSAMALAGALCAGVAIGELMGPVGQYRVGFSPDYGFIGIAVAMLAMREPLFVLPAAFLMAALHKGATDLDMETAHLTRDYSRILQALVIVSVTVATSFPWEKYSWSRVFNRMKWTYDKALLGRRKQLERGEQ
jgi:simple sugar transport system permease protein